MRESHKSPKIFFGWWTVVACGIIGFLGLGFGNLGFSSVFKPLSEDLGLGRAATSIAAGIGSVMGGLAGPLGGWANDRYGPRRVMLIGMMVLVIGFISMFFINSLISFLFVWGVIVGLGTTLGPAIMTDRAIVNWFVKKSGMAVNIKFAIQALSGILLLPLIAFLVTNHGWRVTYIIAGIIVMIVTIPLTWFFVKPHRPEHYGLLPDGATRTVETNQTAVKQYVKMVEPELAEFTFRQTVRTSAYWLVIVIAWVSGFSFPMMNAHFIPFLTDKGIGPIQAASMMGVISVVNIPARLIAGFIADRINSSHLRYIMAAGVFLQACGTAAYLVGGNMAGIYTWIIFYGIGFGVTQSALFPLMVRYFGRKSFGSITGLTSMLMMPVGLLAPIYIGWVYDTTGAYTRIIGLMTGLLMTAGIIACFIRRPRLLVRSSTT